MDSLHYETWRKHIDSECTTPTAYSPDHSMLVFVQFRRDFDVYSRRPSNGNTHRTPTILYQQLTTHPYCLVQSIFRLR